MNRKLPNLKALAAFEAAARLGSFTKAADELFVTQAAISQHIRQLEESLEVPLFIRKPRSLSLTREGLRLLPSLSSAFDLMADSLDKIKKKPDNNRLSVSLTPALAAKWLVLRLPEFWQQFPEIDLRLHHSISPVDFVNDDIDVAIRWGEGDWPGLTAEFLIPGELVPVCSPSLLVGRKPLAKPSDLVHHTLLHEDSHDDWEQWLKMAGIESVEGTSGPIIDDSNALLLAAADGQGVALGRTAFIREDLAAGRLVKPFDLVLQKSQAYYLVYPEGAQQSAGFQAFRTFLKQQVKASFPKHKALEPA
ncbi:transcriptional regulator GcvA [Parendozoicomonas haliclonae]|uniref:Glycine cleavage system transcriptional activator n=1 Tax=Parendozoicomonas haliclonae TaxID=1960125 RepID=A0A1X7AHF0_9GAMM|nr:transcriptional regulator GcvA [Parendozoicomonas haliclonae]SMA40349.1 Glycine cleavage system transcriptional activator [Parendozoicomonas haliclonae]